MFFYHLFITFGYLVLSGCTGETSEVFLKFATTLKSDKRPRKFILIPTSYIGNTKSATATFFIVDSYFST